MKVAVTGGSGQLGTHVLRRLLADRKIKEIRCLDVRPPILPPGRRLAYIRADVRDPDLHRHLEGMDAVIHLAFIIVAHLPRPEFDAINVGGSRNVFEAAVAAGVRRILYSSSIAAYGLVPGHPVPIVETSPRRRDEILPYAAAKYDVEAYLDELERRQPDLAVIRLRPGILVGDRMENPFGTALRLGVLPDMSLALPVVWDEDVADAAVRALLAGARGAFNLVAAEALPARELAGAAGLKTVRSRPRLARALVRLAGRPVDPAWLSGSKDVVLVASSARAQAELGHAPRFPTAAAVLRHFRASAPRRLDARLEVFFALLRVAARFTQLPDEARHVTARIHLDLRGPRGGDVEIAIAGGRMRIHRRAPRPPTSVLRLETDTLLELLSGRTDLATAQLVGRVLIDGDPIAGMVLGALVGNFRRLRKKVHA